MASMPLLRDLDLSEVLSQPGTGKGTLLVLGAGASAPIAPVAAALKAGILDGCSKLVGDKSSPLPEDGLLTLEVLCSLLRFRLGDRLDLVSLLSSILKSNVVPQSAFIQAELIKRRLVTYVLTANFDDFLYRACKDVGTPFTLVTRMQLEDSTTARHPGPGDIFAFHGTLYKPTDNDGLHYSPPTSADARGLATPFSASIEAYIKEVLTKVETIVLWGYSGSDHYDLDPVLSKLLAVNRNTVRSVYWLSYNGNKGKDFSRSVAESKSALAREEGARRVVFVDCQRDVISPFDRYLSKIDREWVIRPCSTERSKDPANVTWAFLEANLKSSDATRNTAAIKEFLIDVCHSQIWRVWLIIEHFYLDSLGLTSDALRNFGAYSSCGSFLECDIEKLSNALESYWSLNNIGAHGRRSKFASSLEILVKNSSSQGSLAMPVYDTTLFKGVADSLTRVLDQAHATLVSGRKLRNIDAALLEVCSAIAENYCGLIMLREYEDCLEWKDEAPASDSRVREARSRAKRHLERSVKFSRAAKSSLSGGRNKGMPDLLDLVSPDVWHDIALFNKARVTVDYSRAICYMVEVIKRQDKLINEADNYLRAAHALQICQRASVLLKRIFGVKGNADPPTRVAGVYSPKVRWALKIVKERSKNYEELTGRFEGRLFAVCDALVVDALARGKGEEAEEILSGFCKKQRHRPEEDKGKIEGWIANIQDRIQSSQRIPIRRSVPRAKPGQPRTGSRGFNRQR